MLVFDDCCHGLALQHEVHVGRRASGREQNSYLEELDSVLPTATQQHHHHNN